MTNARVLLLPDGSVVDVSEVAAFELVHATNSYGVSYTAGARVVLRSGYVLHVNADGRSVRDEFVRAIDTLTKETA